MASLFEYYLNTSSISSTCINPFKPSGVKWLHFKMFRGILV